jgi:hypothetical protein
MTGEHAWLLLVRYKSRTTRTLAFESVNASVCGEVLRAPAGSGEAAHSGQLDWTHV